jgi:hypothetical protein
MLSASPLVADAQQQANTIALSCDGTITDESIPTPLESTPKPIEGMGVVVNFNERTVTFMDYITSIDSTDAAAILFGREQVGPMAQVARKNGFETQIFGRIDRVSGYMDATATTAKIDHTYAPGAVTIVDHYQLRCTATKPAF